MIGCKGFDKQHKSVVVELTDVPVCDVCLPQVEEIVVRPEAEITFIKLYDGAIIKGQQVNAIYQLFVISYIINPNVLL